jgi:ribosomal protein L32
MNNSKQKTERFKRVASKRVAKVLTAIKGLSKCANTGNYEYSQDEVAKMTKAIRDEFKIMESLFKTNLKNDSDNFTF